MNEKTTEKILKGIAIGQVVTPELITLIAHYRALMNDPRLQETDKAIMVQNLQSLALTDWKDIEPA